MYIETSWSTGTARLKTNVITVTPMRVGTNKSRRRATKRSSRIGSMASNPSGCISFVLARLPPMSRARACLYAQPRLTSRPRFLHRGNGRERSPTREPSRDHRGKRAAPRRRIRVPPSHPRLRFRRHGPWALRRGVPRDRPVHAVTGPAVVPVTGPDHTPLDRPWSDRPQLPRAPALSSPLACIPPPKDRGNRRTPGSLRLVRFPSRCEEAQRGERQGASEHPNHVRPSRTRGRPSDRATLAQQVVQDVGPTEHRVALKGDALNPRAVREEGVLLGRGHVDREVQHRLPLRLSGKVDHNVDVRLRQTGVDPVRDVLRGPSLRGLALRGEVADVEAVRGGVGAPVLIEGVPRLGHRVRVVRWIRIVREPPAETRGHGVRVRVT